MKFGQQFEFHKIPEWYDEYLDYRMLKALLKRASDRKLRGVYYFTKDSRTFRINGALVNTFKHQLALSAQSSGEFLQAEIKTVLTDMQISVQPENEKPQLLDLKLDDQEAIEIEDIS